MSTQFANVHSGFRDAVHDAQAVFRSVMRAMAQPALPVGLPSSLAPPAPLNATTAAILLALADFETTLWLDAPLAGTADVRQFASFHTGARLVADAADAHFAIASAPQTMPALGALNQGTPEYPDRSTTLIVQVAGFGGAGLLLRGPGIKGVCEFSFAGMRADIARDLAGNRARFPCGVDIVLTGPAHVAALPRSVRLATEG